MPTIDELAPATAASDADEIPVSQSGVTRKVTRAQVLAGVQPALAIPSGRLMGRVSAGNGAPEPITIGANLTLSGSTLVANAVPFSIVQSPAGTVPAAGDSVPIGQGGTNSAVTYGQFMSGLPAVANVDASRTIVTPTGASASVKLADLAARIVPITGGTMTGALSLAADPITPFQAATKAYVDAQATAALPKAGGTLAGPLTLASDPTTALQASSKQYVDARLLRAGDTLTGSLVLSADPTVPLQAATKRYVDNQVGLTLPLAGGAITGPLTLSGSPTVALQAATKQYVDGQFATTLPLAGGILTGALTLASAPTSLLSAATKQYVDTATSSTGVINVKAAPYNAQLNGTADDTAAFKAAYQAAPAGSVIYVPFGIAVLQSTAIWGTALTKRVKWIVDGTTLADGTSLAAAIPNGTGPAAFVLPGVVVGNTGAGPEVSQGTSQASDFSVLHTSYIVNHNGGSGSVITNTRNDTIIYNSPNNYVWGGLDRLVWAGVQTPAAGAPAQHVARYTQTIRATIATDTAGVALPQPELWATCLEYRDVTGRPSSWANASITAEMDWFGNGADDAGNRQIQSLVVGQHNTSGAPVEVSSVIGVYLAAGSSGRVNKVFNVGIPFATAILDTTYSQQLSGASAIRLAAGHAIAFEPSGSNRLLFDSTSNTLRWNQGTLSYVVGKGITVGWQSVISGSFAVPAYIAGNIIFLVGSGSYTVSLPSANSVPSGVGFTFSATGPVTVSVTPAGGDVIDNGPVILRQSDRYHIVSDNSNTWREVFRANSVSPRFSGPPVLPSYTVANLPNGPGTGAKAFATNGRKPNESSGAGTGVEVFYDGARWITGCSGTATLA